MSRRVLAGYSFLVYAFLFFPIIVVVVYAFNAGNNVAQWGGFSTKWFGIALADPSITDSILRSLQIAAASTAISVVLGTAAALTLARARQKVQARFDSIAFMTMVVPELVIAVALLIFFVNAGFELGPVPMTLGHSLFGSSMVMLVVRARFVGIGPQLEEAGADLGASPLRVFMQVTLPQIAPAVFAGGMLAFTLSFDDVVISQFTSGAGNQTWPLRVLSGLRFGLRPDLNAAATLMLAVTFAGFVSVAIVYRLFGRPKK